MSTTDGSGFRYCVSLSTQHISKEDMALLKQPMDDDPCTAPYTHGSIIFGCGITQEDLAAAMDALRQRGHTEAFIALYKVAFSDQNTRPILMSFHPSAPILKTLPVYPQEI